MSTIRLRLFHVATAALLSTTLALTACGDSSDPGRTDSNSESDGESTDGNSSSTSGDTTAGPTSDPGTGSSSSSSTTDPGTSDDSAAFLTNGMQTTTDAGPLPNGSMCSADSDCESMKCYEIPMLGGLCSECKTSSDCPPETPSCSLDALTMQAKCVEAAPGVQCTSDAVCEGAGLVCTSVIPGIELLFPEFQTCGECTKNGGECMDGQVCNGQLDLMNFGGYTQCIDPGTVPNDSLCFSNEACTSGICNKTMIDGVPLLTIDICGECASDQDCQGNSTCMPGSIDIMGGGLSGSTCV
ncbi:MAG: hypothetical protein H6713_04950 [Myxococcales bacterium]|nr:hypothetical protein [Myxococcales bacterium]MCB9749341.1 hypothetical protein [Myxococcales bacterium]